MLVSRRAGATQRLVFFVKIFPAQPDRRFGVDGAEWIRSRSALLPMFPGPDPMRQFHHLGVLLVAEHAARLSVTAGHDDRLVAFRNAICDPLRDVARHGAVRRSIVPHNSEPSLSTIITDHFIELR